MGDVAPQGVLGWTANEYGAGGNSLNMILLNRGAQQRTTEVVVDGSTISVYLAADSSGNIVATADDVYQAFLSNTEASTMITMDDPNAIGYGGMVVEPFTQLFFNGGSGANDGDYFTFNTTAPGGAELISLSVNGEGGIIGVFENGSTEEMARVSLAKIPNPQGMVAIGQGKFTETPVSGSGFPPVVPGTGGTGGIASGFLEMSNVDLTREFTDMIINQRGFQANSRIITTSDELLQELMSIKR
jgi:flagellar hook protein FlgE